MPSTKRPTHGYFASNLATQSLSTSLSLANKSAQSALRSFSSRLTLASARLQSMPAKQLYGPPAPRRRVGRTLGSRWAHRGATREARRAVVGVHEVDEQARAHPDFATER